MQNSSEMAVAWHSVIITSNTLFEISSVLQFRVLEKNRELHYREFLFFMDKQLNMNNFAKKTEICICNVSARWQP